MDSHAPSPIVLALASAGSCAELAAASVTAFAEDANVVLARVWLAGPGDRCETCTFQLVCPDRSRCLHLVASAGTSRAAGTDISRVEGQHRRVPIGVRKIGLIARTRRPLIAGSLRGTEAWIADPQWVDVERVASFAGFPLTGRDGLHGVVAVFDRRQLDDQLRAERARHAAELGIALDVVSKLADLTDDRRRLLEETGRQDASWAEGDPPLLVGDSSVHSRIAAQVELTATSSAPVLIVGAPGTGRTTAARAIHLGGRGPGRALIRVDLIGPTDDLAARLFGVREGAATRGRSSTGLLALAEGGTLLLDELGRLPPALHGPLGDWLDRNAAAPDEAHAVRVIATCTPEVMTLDDGLLQRILDRLAVIRIDLPPLRDRGDDVMAIARRMAGRVANRIGRESPTLTPAALDWLSAYHWPGNLAELHAVLDRAVRICGDLLAPDALEFRHALDATVEPGAATILTRAQLRQRERENVRAALAAARGRVSGPGGAAELLGVKPTTLASRIRALGLVRQARRRDRADRA